MSGEKIFRPFVFFITFIGITMLLVSQMWELALVSEINTETATGWEVIGGVPYQAWSPNYTHVDNASIVHAVYQYGSNPTPTVRFYKPASLGGTGAPNQRDDVVMWVVRNNSYWHYNGATDKWHEYKDFVFFDQNQGDFWGPKHRSAAIPLQTFDNAFDNQTNISVIDFNLGGTNFTAIISTAGHFNSYLYWNDYNFTLCQRFGANIQAKTSMWALLGQLLTLHLPNVNWIINLIIAIPFWAGIGFIAFTFIIRVLPFVGD